MCVCECLYVLACFCCLHILLFLWSDRQRPLSFYILFDLTCSRVYIEKKPFNSLIHRTPPSCLCDRHQSAAAVNISQQEFMPTSVPLSSCLLLNPLENSPPKVLWNALHQSHTNERHYTLQSVWFKDDLQSFPSAVRNGNLPGDKLRIHLQYSKDIKGFKLCIGGVGVRTTKKGFLSDVKFP